MKTKIDLQNVREEMFKMAKINNPNALEYKIETHNGEQEVYGMYERDLFETPSVTGDDILESTYIWMPLNIYATDVKEKLSQGDLI